MCGSGYREISSQEPPRGDRSLNRLTRYLILAKRPRSDDTMTLRRGSRQRPRPPGPRREVLRSPTNKLSSDWLTPKMDHNRVHNTTLEKYEMARNSSTVRRRPKCLTSPESLARAEQDARLGLDGRAGEIFGYFGFSEKPTFAH